MKTPFTSEELSNDGRSGTVNSTEWLLDIALALSKALRGQAPVLLMVDNNLPDLPVTEEKNLGRDLDLIDELPAKTRELTALMDASEKTTGEERAAVTQDIRDTVRRDVSRES